MSVFLKDKAAGTEIDSPRYSETAERESQSKNHLELEDIFRRNHTAKKDMAEQLHSAGLSMEAVNRILHLPGPDHS